MTKAQNMKINQILFPGLLIFVLIAMNSCKAVDPCPEQAAKGNTGGLFNTINEEYSPSFLNDTLYYTALEAGKKSGEKIHISYFKDNAFTPPVIDTALPIYNIKNSGLPTFYDNKLSGIVELYFAGISEMSGRINRDIYFSEKINGQWSEPKAISAINTPAYESHPAISPDGKILAFTSDREGSVGDLDIYLSFRNPDGSWGEPINAGLNINTDKTEISPHIGSGGRFYYASKGFAGEGGYDIMASKFNGKNLINPAVLPFPINTEWDETSPNINGEMIYLASDRRGGCGGKDLYAFTLCGPVILEIKIEAQNENLPLEGTFVLLDEYRNELSKFDVDGSGLQRILLKAGKNYIIQYFNDCVPQYVPEQRISAPCDDESTVKLIANFIIPDEFEEFDFERYEVPFFVSGYYMPISQENLNDLKTKFQYNMIGNTPDTKYIENPGENYDQYSPVVEMALKQAADFIFKIINNLKNSCIEGSSKKIVIKVTGYADPRMISDIARYQDDSISDTEVEFSIERGAKMDNLLLSQLRAYFTAKQFINYLKKYHKYDSFADRLQWQIIGKGIDENEDRENLLKRRVNIEIGVNE